MRLVFLNERERWFLLEGRLQFLWNVKEGAGEEERGQGAGKEERGQETPVREGGREGDGGQAAYCILREEEGRGQVHPDSLCMRTMSLG